MNLCPKCNSELIVINSGRDHIVKCSKCDFEVVSTNSNSMDFDTTQYEISIEPGNTPSIVNIKFISKLFGCNFIEAKEILLNGKMLAKGYAIEIVSKRDLLMENNIKYVISPNFPY